MKPPDNERRVLTWARDVQGIELWQIDSYSINHVTGRGFWGEATAWHMQVLFWKELDPKPEYEEYKPFHGYSSFRGWGGK